MLGTEDELMCGVLKNLHVGYRRKTYVWGTEEKITCGGKRRKLMYGVQKTKLTCGVKKKTYVWGYR